MRQLMSFLKHIGVRNTKKEYYRMKFSATLANKEIIPLDEVLGVSFSEETPFSPEVDKELEERAKRFVAGKNV